MLQKNYIGNLKIFITN